MKLTDFATLAEANAYVEQGTKMISADMMVAFLATFGIYRAVQAEDSEAAAGATVSFIGYWSAATGGTWLAYSDIADESYTNAGTLTVTDADLELNL